MLTVIRVSNPRTEPEQALLAAVRILRVPHAIMRHPCRTVAEWMQQFGPH